MDDIEKELELLIDEEVRLEAEQVRKRREAEQAAAEALKAVAGKRPLDEVSTEVGSTGAGSSLKKTRVGQEEPQGPTDEHLAQQQLELKQLEEEGDRLQRLLLEKQQEVLLEKQRQEEQKAREAAEKKKREEAEQRAREKAAAEERAVREREEARRSAELLLKQEQERKRKETEDLLSAKKARVLELKRQLGQEVAKLQVEKEPTPPLRRSSAFDEASLHGADPASVPESRLSKWTLLSTGSTLVGAQKSLQFRDGRLWARRIVVGVLGAVRSALSGSEQFGVPGVARRLAKFFSSFGSFSSRWESSSSSD